MIQESSKVKIGLEVHYQLDTGKLFCRCPSSLRDDEPDYKIKRSLKSVSSELGEKDIVAEFEMAKNKHAVYECYDTNTCLIEVDEEPILEMNEKALEAGLQICLLLDANIVDYLQVMRKQVLDLSNTSGFQRTCLVGFNGKIETSKGEVKIQTIVIEEDAARKIKEEKDSVVYRLDRLGIPLIEIVTSPDIKDGEHAKEVAEKIGMIVKSTGLTRKGIGSVRQDVNLSVNSNNRVELKGFQDLRNMPKVIEKEIERHLEILKKGKKIEKEVRKVNADCTTDFLRPMPGASRMYVETDHPVIEISKEILNKIKKPETITEKAIKLEKLGLNAELAREIVKEKIDFMHYANFNIDKVFVAHALVEIPKEIKRRFNLDVSKLDEKIYEEVFNYLEKNEINKEAVLEILKDYIKNGKIEISKYKQISVDDVEEFVKKLVRDNPDVSINGLMGDVMRKYKGTIDGKKVMDLLKKYKL